MIFESFLLWLAAPRSCPDLPYQEVKFASSDVNGDDDDFFGADATQT